ncbi:hypothetical protein [Tenacibaculum xiamenense]|uniref:hypothetical protein n=1 Tax=Tenacibaculum xiamenense TaxID=1261553 RepID=UPI0038954FDE
MALNKNILLKKGTSLFLLMLFLSAIVLKAIHHHNEKSVSDSSNEVTQIYQAIDNHCDICSFSIPNVQLLKLTFFHLVLPLVISKIVIDNYQISKLLDYYNSNFQLRAPPITI